jgi:hypothetical protein
MGPPPNGAGKSTTMRMILGLDTPDGGRAPRKPVTFPGLTVKDRWSTAVVDRNRLVSSSTEIMATTVSSRAPRRRLPQGPFRPSARGPKVPPIGSVPLPRGIRRAADAARRNRAYAGDMHAETYLIVRVRPAHWRALDRLAAAGWTSITLVYLTRYSLPAALLGAAVFGLPIALRRTRPLPAFGVL